MYEMLGLNELLRTPRFDAHDHESITSILDSAEHIARKYYLPLATSLDANEPKFVHGRVEMIPGIREAVSYTHLDVYKRQIHGSMASSDMMRHSTMPTPKRRR